MAYCVSFLIFLLFRLVTTFCHEKLVEKPTSVSFLDFGTSDYLVNQVLKNDFVFVNPILIMYHCMLSSVKLLWPPIFYLTQDSATDFGLFDTKTVNLYLTISGFFSELLSSTVSVTFNFTLCINLATVVVDAGGHYCKTNFLADEI